MLAHVDGGWEQHSRHQLMHVWGSPELAGRVFDAYLCVTEYVLTAGDPYDRVAGFAKRLRAQAHQAGRPPGRGVRRDGAGGDGECSPATSRPPARTSSTPRGSVESWARLEASHSHACVSARRCFIWATAAGARAQLEEALELAQISPIAEHLLFLVCGVLLQVPDEGVECARAD